MDSLRDRVVARHLEAGKMTPEQEISYALGVAQGNVPAYAEAMARKFWVERALSLMTGPQKKRLTKNLGKNYDEVKRTLDKILAAIEAWIDSQEAVDKARLKVDDLASEASRLEDLLETLY
jgi:hypothetical protein